MADIQLTLWDQRGCCGGRPWNPLHATLHLSDSELRDWTVSDLKKKILTLYYSTATPSHPSRKVYEDHPASWSRLMAKNALLKDSTPLSTIFAPNSSTQAFFGVAKSSPWDEMGQEIVEDETCPVNKDATSASC